MRSSVPWILFLLCCGVLAPAHAHDDFVESDCEAEAEVELTDRTEADDTIRLQYTIDLTGDADCSEVRYDLVVNELLPNGQWKSFRRSRSVTLRDGSFRDSVVHTMASDLKLLGQRILVASCRRCEAD